MNKLFTALLLVLFSFTANSQVNNSRDYKYSNQMNIGKGGSTMVATDTCAMLELGSEGINRALLLPRGDTAGIPLAKRGAIFYNLADSSVYFRTRNKWNKLSTVSSGGGSLPVILPKSSSIPSVGLETAMIYYNSTTNNVDLYDGSWGAIQRKNPVTTTTSASGITWNSTITPQVVLNATSNAINQTIPAHSTSYTGWKVEFRVINAASNTITFRVPSSAYVNGVTGGTSFTASNGNVVTVINDGTQWIITNK